MVVDEDAAPVVLENAHLMYEIAMRLPAKGVVNFALASQDIYSSLQVHLTLHQLNAKADDSTQQPPGQSVAADAGTPSICSTSLAASYSFHSDHFQGGQSSGCAALSWLLPRLANIQRLTLSLPSLPEPAVVGILQACAGLHSLTHLAIDEANLLTDAAAVLGAWLPSLSGLQHLQLTSAQLTPDSVHHLLAGLHALRTLTALDLTNTTLVRVFWEREPGNNLLQPLLQMCQRSSNLRILNLPDCTYVPDPELWHGAHNLTRLYISIRSLGDGSLSLPCFLGVRNLHIQTCGAFKQNRMPALHLLTALTALACPADALPWGGNHSQRRQRAHTCRTTIPRVQDMLPALVHLDLKAGSTALQSPGEFVEVLTRLRCLRNLTYLSLGSVLNHEQQELVLGSLASIRELDFYMLFHHAHMQALGRLTTLTRLMLNFMHASCPESDTVLELALQPLRGLRSLEVGSLTADTAETAHVLQAVAGSAVTRVTLRGFSTWDGGTSFLLPWRGHGDHAAQIAAPTALRELRILRGMEDGHICSLEVLHLLTRLTLLHVEVPDFWTGGHPIAGGCETPAIAVLGRVLSGLHGLRDLRVQMPRHRIRNAWTVAHGLEPLTLLTSLELLNFLPPDPEALDQDRNTCRALTCALERMRLLQVLHVKHSNYIVAAALSGVKALTRLRALTVWELAGRAQRLSQDLGFLSSLQKLTLEVLLSFSRADDERGACGLEWLSHLTALSCLQMRTIPHRRTAEQCLLDTLPRLTALQLLYLRFDPDKWQEHGFDAVVRLISSMPSLVHCRLAGVGMREVGLEIETPPWCNLEKWY